MKKFLIVAHYSRFLVQFELNDVKLLQGMGYEVHYATNFEHEDMYADAVQVIREHGAADLSLWLSQMYVWSAMNRLPGISPV